MRHYFGLQEGFSGEQASEQAAPTRRFNTARPQERIMSMGKTTDGVKYQPVQRNKKKHNIVRIPNEPI